jgi:small subunit ribosomal protein S11
MVTYSIPKRASRRKRIKRKVQKGIVHIQATYNNTLVTISTIQGIVLTWNSAGASGFRGTRKSTPFAAKIAAENAIKKSLEQGLQEARVYVWGPGPGRETAIRRVHEIGIRVTMIRDITSLPHNGCRSPKRRRILNIKELHSICSTVIILLSGIPSHFKSLIDHFNIVTKLLVHCAVVIFINRMELD